MTIQFSSQAIAALSATPLQVWQTITLGTYKGVDAYRDVMDSAGIKIRDSANEILARPAFPYARVKTEVETRPAFRLGTRRGNGIFAFRRVQTRKASWP